MEAAGPQSLQCLTRSPLRSKNLASAIGPITKARDASGKVDREVFAGDEGFVNDGAHANYGMFDPGESEPAASISQRWLSARSVQRILGMPNLPRMFSDRNHKVMDFLQQRLRLEDEFDDLSCRWTATDLVREGLVHKWFFIRFGDPKHHLRIRLEGSPPLLMRKVLPRWQEVLDRSLRDRAIDTIQVDTYEPEIERYGGPHGITPAESVFHADSTAVGAMAHVAMNAEASRVRWQACLYGIHRLMEDMGINGASRVSLLREMRTTYGGEAQFGDKAKSLRSELASKYRLMRPDIENLINLRVSAHENLSRCIRIIDDRSRDLAKPISDLQERAMSGKLTKSLAALAASFTHMHVNRMLRSAHQQHEFVLYDILLRVYSSELARDPVVAPARSSREALGEQRGEL